MTFHAREYSGLARPNFVSAISSELPMSTGGFSVMRALYRSVASTHERNTLNRVGEPPATSNPPSKEPKLWPALSAQVFK
jgi:hypothetical protein